MCGTGSRDASTALNQLLGGLSLQKIKNHWSRAFNHSGNCTRSLSRNNEEVMADAIPTLNKKTGSKLQMNIGLSGTSQIALVL